MYILVKLIVFIVLIAQVTGVVGSIFKKKEVGILKSSSRNCQRFVHRYPSSRQYGVYTYVTYELFGVAINIRSILIDKAS